LTRSLPVDFATLHPFRAAFGSLSHCASVAHPGLHICLSVDQCAIARVFSLRSIILPYRAPCGSLIRRFQLLTLAGLLMQSFSATASIPERLPKPPESREALPSSSLPPENSADSSVLS
jgi:hypothetical protein